MYRKQFESHFPVHFVLHPGCGAVCGMSGLRTTHEVNMVSCKNCQKTWSYIEARVERDSTLRTLP